MTYYLCVLDFEATCWEGMVGMLQYLKLKLDGMHQSGIDDTKNIAKIMIKMIKDDHKSDSFMFYYV